MKETAKFETTDYVSPRRQEGIKKLATYVMFERLMQQVDDQRIDREAALNRAPVFYQAIMGVEK